MTEPNFNKQDGVSLKEYFDERLKSLEHALCLKITALAEKTDTTYRMSQTAIDKAEKTVNLRLEMMNEFRDAMKDQAKESLPKTMFDAVINIFDKRIKDLELERAKVDGKASQTALLFTMGVSLIGIILGLLNYFGG